MTTPIPQPRGIPFLGNAAQIDAELPFRSFQLLAKQYGEIYQLNVTGKQLVYVATYALLNELSDEKRFKKVVAAGLMETRNLLGDGLFSANNEEPNWGVAHRLLMPAFGPAAIRGMMPGMRDIASQLLLKWSRFGPDAVIEPADDFTRVALDTISFCSMSYRLNSFYTEGKPPFTEWMTDFLKESGARTRRPAIVQAVMRGAGRKYEKDMGNMRELATKIVNDRKTHPSDKDDLLNKMLNGKDPKTGQGMTDDSIIKNLLTFMIAGHETSSGTLTFVTYFLLKNPHTMRRLREEVDSTLGARAAEVDDLANMPYLNAVIREAMRLYPAASARSVTPHEDTTIGGGKYAVKAGSPITILTAVAQRDPAVFGEDANEFKPERMLDGKFEALPPNAWQPFGYGMRGCIGRAFAWQEMQLVIASYVQHFDLTMVDPSHTLEIKQALTIKPKDFYIRATPRAVRPISTGATEGEAEGETEKMAKDEEGGQGKQKMYVLYGSNTGTSEAFAQRIAGDAPANGFHASLDTLDSAAYKLPTDGPVVIVTASFEGEPADNAAAFVDWLRSLSEPGALDGVRYTVFGCGNHDWVRTYQRIPTLVDSIIGEKGGKKLVGRGEGDAGNGKIFEAFDEWEAAMWAALSKEFQTTKSAHAAPALEVKLVEGADRAKALRQPDAAFGTVVENRLLTKPDTPEKRHIEFALPEGTTSRAGDYLAVIPNNPMRDVRRVLAHFGLPSDQEIELKPTGPTSLPVGKAISAVQLLLGYVELSQPATTRDLKLLMTLTESEDTKATFEDLIKSHTEKVLATRISILTLLEKHLDVKISFSAFLVMLPSMRARQYSISSSPLWNPTHATLTISVLSGPPADGQDEPFLGVASTFLASLRPGDRVQIAVRPSNDAFHPPADPTVPVIMFCAGSGLAPMRGFVQERAAQKAGGREVAPMVLFFGCRSPDEDYLYSDSDLKEWSDAGIVDMRPAFSRKSDASEGCKYVQDRIWHDRVVIRENYKKGAKFFTCGSGKVATGIKATLADIIKEKREDQDGKKALEDLDAMSKGRYASDIFD